MVDAEGKPDIETPAYQVSVEKGQYTLVFPGKSFSQVPVLVVTPLGGATVLDIKREQREDAWLVQIQLSEQVPVQLHRGGPRRSCSRDDGGGEEGRRAGSAGGAEGPLA